MIPEVFPNLSDSETQLSAFPGPQQGAAARAVQGQGARAELGIAAPAKPTGTSQQGLRSGPSSLDSCTCFHGIQPGINSVLGEQLH